MIRGFLAVAALVLAAGTAASAIPLDEADELTSAAAILAQAAQSFARGDAAGAQASYQRCLSAAREQNDRTDLALCEVGLAQADASPQLQQNAAALGAAHTALALIDDRTPDGPAFSALAQTAAVLRIERQPREAMAAYRRSLARVSGGGHELDFYRQGIAEDGISGCYLDLRNYTGAQGHADWAAALMLKEPQHRDTTELSVLQNAGEVNWGLHRYDAAKIRFDQALALADGDLHSQPGDGDRIARIVQRAQYGAGDTALQQGLPLKSVSHLTLCTASRADMRFAAMCAIDSAEADQQRGDDRAAADALALIRDRVDSLDDPDKIAYYGDASLAALDTGDLQTAQTDANAALADARTDRNPFDVGRAYYAAAFVEHFIGNAKRGDELQAAALHAWRGLSPETIARYAQFGAAADTHALQTTVYRTMPLTAATARSAAREAEGEAQTDRRNGALRKAQMDFIAAAGLRLQTRDTTRALADALAARGSNSDMGDWRSLWLSAQVLSRVEQARGDDDAAAQTCADGISSLEKKRSELDGLASEEAGAQIGDIDLAQTHLADAYERCIALQFRVNSEPGRALGIFDSEQGRLILQHFRASGAERVVGISSPQRDELAQKQMALAAAENMLANAQGDAGAVQAARNARGDLDSLVVQLQSEYPAYAFMSEPQRFRNVASWQAALRPNEAMLIYDVQQEDVFAWLLSRSSVRGIRLGSTRRLVGNVRSYMETMHTLADRPDESHALREPRTRSRLDALAATLGDELLPAALRNYARTYSRLIVVPTGPLYSIPFAALRVQGEYAVEQWSFSYISSPSLLAVIRSAEQRALQAPRELLAFAAPVLNGPGSDLRGDAALAALGPLSNAAEEARNAENIIGAAQSLVFQDEQMTKDRLLELDRSGDLERYRYVLFATHAIVSDERPLIVLSHPNLATGEGILSAADVAGLHMDARLVVLSACETAYTLEHHREGEAEFAQAFFAAGSRAQAMTLWPVYDDVAGSATKILFAQLAAGNSPDDALRAVQLAMLKSDGSTMPAYASNPYVWGAYVVFGDGL